MPIAITRPSIIGAAWREPIGGWIDTISAAGVIFVSVGVGLLKMIQGMPFSVTQLNAYAKMHYEVCVCIYVYICTHKQTNTRIDFSNEPRW